MYDCVRCAEAAYRKKQQELEDEHEDIEYELRCLLGKADELKTASERVREESLLQELMDTVSLRNSIVDTIEENRIKYVKLQCPSRLSNMSATGSSSV